MKRYTINKISRYLGISGEMLRHYERLGLISPKRGENGYRSYTALDVSVIMRMQYFQSMGMSLRTCGRLINDSDLADTAATLTAEIESARLRAERARLAAEECERIALQMQALPDLLEKCHIETCPAMRYLPYRISGTLLEFPGMELELPKWLEAMPCANAGPCFALEDIESGTSRYAFGLLIEERYAERFGLSSHPPVRLIPSQLCLSMIFSVSGHDPMHLGVLSPLLRYARENSYAPCGDAYGRSITVTHASSSRERYHQIWLPVKKIERNA